MCLLNEDCDGDESDYWQDEPVEFGMASIAAFGCEKCGASEAL